MLISILIFGFMVARCSSYEVMSIRYHIMSGLYVVSFIDDVVRFLAARYKILFCFSPYTMLEILMIVSHFQVGYGKTIHINGIPSRTWLEFAIMRPIFIYRSYMEMEKHLPMSSKGWMMTRHAIKQLLRLIFGATVMFFLETLGEMPFFTNNGFAHLYACQNGTISRELSNECATETWSIMFTFYFTVVTLGTVGYGDNAPKTVLSRLLTIMFIVAGIILFSLEIENLINLYRMKMIGNPPYTPKINTFHVVITGNPSFSQLMSILRELFHEDHQDTIHAMWSSSSSSSSSTTTTTYSFGTNRHLQLHAVILGERKSKFTKKLIQKIEADPIFAARVTFVAGNALRFEDLERAKILDAYAHFVFPDKLAGDATKEDAKKNYESFEYTSTTRKKKKKKKWKKNGKKLQPK
jgi:hypothetical protein